MKSSRAQRLILFGAWLLAISLVLTAAYLGWRVQSTQAAVLDSGSLALSSANAQVEPTEALPASPSSDETAALPEFLPGEPPLAILRSASLHTTIPNRPRQEVMQYTVEPGDSVFGIAKFFNIMPETVLWANYDLLNDNPDILSPGMSLNIPPIDGVYYQWQVGDTLDSVASKFKAKAEDISNYTGNKLDLTNPSVEVGAYVMVPGGEREFRTWIVPTIPREKAGVSKSVYGPGACEGSYDGAYGSGVFIWPSSQHVLSGNEYWSGHLGIDIAGTTGDGVYASDAGVVVFSGWSTGGYGYMVMIDHGNGYQSVYAHLSKASAYCGQSLYQGQYLGAIGSTGNSTGSHLHFEIRYLGGFINPYYVLP